MAILSNFENENSEHDFKVINLKYEYPGYRGKDGIHTEKKE